MNLEFLTADTTGLVAVGHVLNLTHNLELDVHLANDGIQTVGNQRNLLAVILVGGQIVQGNGSEGAELLLEARPFLEEPEINTIHLHCFFCNDFK